MFYIQVGRRFRLEGSGHAKSRKDARFLTEIRAGLATFFAMAYIISVSIIGTFRNFTSPEQFSAVSTVTTLY
jgi:xanthine/uracil/vitamin C permease (AzgA family)